MNSFCGDRDNNHRDADTLYNTQPIVTTQKLHKLHLRSDIRGTLVDDDLVNFTKFSKVFMTSKDLRITETRWKSDNKHQIFLYNSTPQNAKCCKNTKIIITQAPCRLDSQVYYNRVQRPNSKTHKNSVMTKSPKSKKYLKNPKLLTLKNAQDTN